MFHFDVARLASLCLVSLALAAEVSTLPGQAIAYDLPDLSSMEIYEELRGNPSNPNGYCFSVSPDETWIAVVHYFDNDNLRVLHRPTGRTWDYGWSDTYEAVDPPLLFSEDSRLIITRRNTAPLHPDMESLEFVRQTKETREIPRSFLGFSGSFRNREGEPVGIFQLSQDEGEFGTIAWSPDGTTRYEAMTKGQVKSTFLRVTPAGVNRGVDYGHLLARKAVEDEQLLGEVDSLLTALEETGVSTEEMSKATALARYLERMVSEAPEREVFLDHLVVSPDELLLAGIATASREMGVGGQPVGVLIPLDRGGLKAYPFATNVYGKILWTPDSSAIYFYRQTIAGAGNGTVHRLGILDIPFPDMIEEMDLPVDLLDAPSDAEIARARNEQTKLKHYALLEETFSTPQVIVDYRSGWGFTASGHIIRPFEVVGQDSGALTAYISTQLLDRAVTIRLPDQSDFCKKYSPGGRTGVYSDREKYPLLFGEGMPFGGAPVLIYDDDGLVNLRFQSRKTLERYNRAP